MRYFVLAGLVLLATAACQKMSVPETAAAVPGDGWVSSGGEIFADRQNPWWVKNTDRVGYCVRVDAATFSVDTALVGTIVKEALGYWRSEFSEGIGTFFGAPEPQLLNHAGLLGSVYADVGGGLNSLGIATQTFHEVSCDKAELEFLFGAGTLSEFQKRYLGAGISRFIAAAIRTDYDPISLKGRGFVYVTGDRGPEVIAAAAGAWAADYKLINVLAHELGHVFGVKHGGARLSVMADRFPETVLGARGTVGTRVIPQFLRVPQTRGLCAPAEKLRTAAKAFLGRDVTEPSCLSFTFRQATKRIEISGSIGGGPEIAGGEIFDMDLHSVFEPAVILEMTNAQAVFPEARRAGVRLLVGPVVLRSAAGPVRFQPHGGGPARVMHLRLEGPSSWLMEITGGTADRWGRIFEYGLFDLFY